jgi:hypothetical protein
MGRKMMQHIMAVIILVLFIVLGWSCVSVQPYAGPDAEVKYIEVNLSKNRRYFEGYKEETPSSSNYRAGIGFKAITFLRIKDNELQIDSGGGDYIKFDIETINNLYPQFEVRYKNTRPEPSVVYISVHPQDISKPKENLYFRLDRIDGLISLEEAQKIIAQKEEAEAKEAAERAAQEKARQAQQEQARKAEQERLSNLYRQSGNNLGNLKNTSKRYGATFGNDYITTIYDFGDGTYIEKTDSILGLGLLIAPETGTYRVNGDTVIFLSSKGIYSYGTIVGTALNIGGDIYR